MKTRWMTAPGALLLAAALIVLMIPTYIEASVPTNPRSMDPWMGTKTASFSCGLVVAPSTPTIPIPAGTDDERTARTEHQCAQQRDHRLDQTAAVAVAGVAVLGTGLILGRRRARTAVSPA